MYHLREEGFMATLLFGACLLGFFIYSKKDKAYPFGFQTNANCCDDISPWVRKKFFFRMYAKFFAKISINLWNGVTMKLSVLETVLYILSMLCVGFIEEIIFIARWLLYFGH